MVVGGSVFQYYVSEAFFIINSKGGKGGGYDGASRRQILLTI